MIEPQFTDPELQAEFERQHRYCRQCHPELGRDWLRVTSVETFDPDFIPDPPYRRSKVDWLRAGTWGAALAGSLLFWGWVLGHLAGWMR